MERGATNWLGSSIITAILVASLTISVFHLRAHDAPVLPEILGQWSLLALSVVFGLVGYVALTKVETAGQRRTIGIRAGVGYLLAGIASGGYAWHQHLTPEASLGFDAILFQATFVGLVGGTAGASVGLETARRDQIVAELAETTKQFEAIQENIHTEKRRFESLFQNAPMAVVDLKYTEGVPTVERANAAWEELSGHQRADVGGEDLFEDISFRDGATEAEIADHVMANEIYEGTVTIDRSDGVGHYTLRVIPYEVGKAGERAFAMFTDVTELRQTQQELKETVERVEASNERLERFAYAASHDLREPLRMISNYLQLLEDRYKADLDEDAQEFIEFAVDGADRMRRMIDSLLEFAQITTEGAPLAPTDAQAVLDDVLTDLQPRIEETDATITRDDLPTVTADADQLAQVFRNLIANALKYSGDGSPRVHVGVERTDGVWRFSVADQGIGFDPDRRDDIFDVFETAHSPEEGSDAGIGLALCQRIVDRHDGDIWAESEPGEGATFFFTLPRAEASPPMPATRSPARLDRTRAPDG